MRLKNPEILNQTKTKLSSNIIILLLKKIKRNKKKKVEA